MLDRSPFNLHMARELTNDEIAGLVTGKAKFKTEVVAAGVPHAKWVTNMPAFPKVGYSTISSGNRAFINICPHSFVVL